MFDWEADVRPVLVAIYRAMKEATPECEYMGPLVDSAAINRELGREEPDAQTFQALLVLKDAGYLGAHSYAMGDNTWALVSLSERGLQEVAGWPAAPGGDFAAKLLDLLDERIDATDDPDERGRLQRFREAVVSVGTGVVTNVLTDLARRGI